MVVVGYVCQVLVRVLLYLGLPISSIILASSIPFLKTGFFAYSIFTSISEYKDKRLMVLARYARQHPPVRSVPGRREGSLGAKSFSLSVDTPPISEQDTVLTHSKRITESWRFPGLRPAEGKGSMHTQTAPRLARQGVLLLFEVGQSTVSLPSCHPFLRLNHNRENGNSISHIVSTISTTVPPPSHSNIHPAKPAIWTIPLHPFPPRHVNASMQ